VISPSLISAVVVQLLCQLFKVILYSFKDHRLNLRWFFSAGGMPSAHSAFVTALSVSIGLRQGFGTEFFTIAFVFSMIIIYDSYRLRGTVQNHSQILSRIIEHYPEEQNTSVNLAVGHSIPEIALGILTGGVFAVLVYLLWN